MTGTLRVRPLLAIGAVVFVALSFIAQFRSSSSDSLDEFSFDPSDMVASLVVNRNFADINKHFLLLEALDDGYQPEMGRTYAGMFVVWVPRSLWADKPAVTPGPLFQLVAYGEKSRGGVPPGGVTELRWNFGLWGMLALAAPLGMILGRIDALLRQSIRGGRALYCGLGLLIPTRFISDSLVQVFIEFVVSSTLVGVMLFVIGARVRRTRR